MKRHVYFRLTLLLGALALAPAARSIAQDAGPDETAPEDVQENDEALKPTSIGIRFTPKMSSAISTLFVKQMKPRYELNDKQAEEITDVMQRQFMKFANENAELGRDMIEMMMATMMENDGRFPKDDALQFAKLANQFTPRLKEFFTRSSAEIGKKMSVKQRLQFTGDVGLAAAGLIVFENRMKRWEEGKVGDNANPFFDPADNDPAKTEPEPVDPNEHEDHRRARKNVERWIGHQTNKDELWHAYVEQAVKYYGFSDKQRTAAQSILKDCQDRVRLIKTKDWKDAVTENRITQTLTYSAGSDLSSGPWMQALDDAYQKLVKPIDDLDREFKRRIDDLPDSTQRASARETVRKLLGEKGVKQLPV